MHRLHDVGVAHDDFALVVQDGHHGPMVFYFIMRLRMLHIHLPVPKKRGRDRVVRVLQMLLLLRGREKAPAQQARRHLAGIVLIILLQFAHERLELVGVNVHVADCGVGVPD